MHLCIKLYMCTHWAPLSRNLDVYSLLTVITPTTLDVLDLSYGRKSSGGDLAPSLGGRKTFSADPRFLNDVLLVKNVHFRGKNFSWPFFRHRPDLSDFPFLFPDFPYVCYVKCHIWPFPHRKNTFFYSVHTFTRIRQHYFSKYWGDQCMGRPPPQIFFGGGRPPSTP